jgi:uncharacterized protein (DUF2225 family)
VYQMYTTKEIDRLVMEDMDRPCLFGVMGPCFHPDCLYAHFDTILEKIEKSRNARKERRPTHS